ELPPVHELVRKLPGFAALVQNRARHGQPERVDRAAAELAAQLQALLRGIQERCKDLPYPFRHVRGRLTVAEYSRLETNVTSEWQDTYLQGRAHVDRLLALNYRLTGRVLALANLTEKSLAA